MIRATSLKWSLALLCGFAAAGSAGAQDNIPRKDDAKFRRVGELLQVRTIPPEEIPEAKAAFQGVAKYFAEIVSSSTIYRASLDPKFGPAAPRYPTLDHNRDTGVFFELDRYILIPVPANASKINADKLDYIREFGIAFDAALKPLIETNPERIVRINAMRLYAEACLCGATAFYPTVTKLLNDPKTPTEIKHYALQAAQHLLAAYDAADYKSRRHSNEPKPVGDLVEAVTACVTNFNALIPDVKPAEATADQLAVVSFVRRQAVRALAQYRFVIAANSQRKQLFPAYALVQVCVSDPALAPAPTPAECAEAAIGVCNMAPSMDNNPVKTYNSAGAAEAVAAAIRTWANPRTDPSDRSLAWRNYSTRIGDALKNWRPIFDPLFDPTQPNNFNASDVPPTVNELITRVQSLILAPIDKVTKDGNPDPSATVQVEQLERYLEQLRDNPNRKPLLFSNNPATVIYVPGLAKK
jgi:hypothetical protein